MKRREFLAGTGMLIATASVSSGAAADDETAVRQTVKDAYSTYSAGLKQKYRSLVTEDYLLLENGELLDIEGDIATMSAPESGYKRTDAFDFRSVKVHGDTAYTVYFLKSEITDKKNGTRDRQWLESVILRRAANGWRMALLHSTRIMKPGA